MTTALLRFGDVELYPAQRALRVRGQATRIGVRAFDLLCLLAEADGAVVSRDELLERVWRGQVVGDENLKMQVMALRKLLGADAIVTVPGHGYRLGLARRAEVEPEDAAAAPAAGAAALFGRDADLQRVRQALAAGRLVTLAGPGGIGKTRLALAAAARSGDGHAADRDDAGHAGDASVVVELAALAEAGQIVDALARALALAPGSGLPALRRVLAPLALLLVLDNAEHLVREVAALAADLLAAAPGLRLLVTSQEPLRVEDETVLRIDGLALPASDDGAAVRASPAVALLCARAAVADPLFVLAHGQEAQAAALCRGLDGVPLAIELAAARLPLLGLAGVLARLGAPLALLARACPRAPARQQTLRATLVWSHGLLDAAEKRALRRLAVFAGGFSLDSAEQLLGKPDAPDARGPQPIDLVHSLVDKSLLALRADGDRRRLQMAEATRAFALEQLVEAGELALLRRRHAEVVLALFEAADAGYAATPVLRWTRALLPELANLRAALHWALGSDGRPGDEAMAIALLAASGGFWALMGLLGESAPWFRRLAPRVADPLPRTLQASFWMAFANRGADPSLSAEEAWDALQRAIVLARETGLSGLRHRALGLQPALALRLGRALDTDAVAAEMRACEGEDWNALQRRTRRNCENFALFQRGDWQAYAETQRAELRLQLEAGDDYHAWLISHRLALTEIARGDAAAAVALLRPAVASIRAQGFQRHCWQQVAMLAVAHIETGHAPTAAVHEAVRLLRGAGALDWMAAHLAEWLTQRAETAAAARLLGWMSPRLQGRPIDAQSQAALERARAAVDAAAPAAHIDAWQAEGARWADDDAALMLLGVS